jgi:hypothetical protein
VLVHLCQSLIRQAELVLRQSGEDATGAEREQARETARSLLRQAVEISSAMKQMRGRALQELVRVAGLALGNDETEQGPPLYTYELHPVGGGTRHGGKIVRGVEAPPRSPGAGTGARPPQILIQMGGLEGQITQEDETLFLHLCGLNPALRGRRLQINLPLGSLLEPVRWLGGNPHALRSEQPVDAAGGLSMPLGQTELRLERPEERNLLEVLFLRLEVRAL